MNIDVVRHSVLLPPLEVGDHLIISPVGAYNNTQWQQFIEYRPNVVLVQADGEVALIREREELDCIAALERIPPHLELAPPAEPGKRSG
jgi:diaminopimelate decarboxylase